MGRIALAGRPVGFLVVGAGFLGAQRAAAVMVCPGARLVSVFDANHLAARSVAVRHQADVDIDYATALERDDVDAVIISTPHADHYEQALAAIEAGKHVLCEKPLTVKPEQSHHLAERADELRVRLATGFNHRFYPPVAEALEMVRLWAIGRVESLRVQIGHKAGEDFLAGWHVDVARSGGGTLMDNGPHACDLIRLILGQVIAVKGYTRQDPDLPRNCESEAFALFRDMDQGVAELRSSWSQPRGYLTLEIHGSDGWLQVETAPWRLTGELEGGRRLCRTYVVERTLERLFRLRFGCERSLAREIEVFLSPESQAGNPAATGWDGCRVSEMIEAVYESAELGDEVRLWPPLTSSASPGEGRLFEDRAA